MLKACEELRAKLGVPKEIKPSAENTMKGTAQCGGPRVHRRWFIIIKTGDTGAGPGECGVRKCIVKALPSQELIVQWEMSYKQNTEW